MSEEKKRERVTLSIDKSLMDELRKYCLRDKRPYSSAVEIAVEEYLKKAKKEKK